MPKHPHTARRSNYHRHVVRRREQRGLAQLDIPLCVQRDIILDADPVFAFNIKSAVLRLRQRKITQQMFKHIRNFNIVDALRRAKVQLSVANAMVVAG